MGADLIPYCSHIVCVWGRGGGGGGGVGYFLGFSVRAYLWGWGGGGGGGGLRVLVDTLGFPARPYL